MAKSVVVQTEGKDRPLGGVDCRHVCGREIEEILAILWTSDYPQEWGWVNFTHQRPRVTVVSTQDANGGRLLSRYDALVNIHNCIFDSSLCLSIADRVPDHVVNFDGVTLVADH